MKTYVNLRTKGVNFQGSRTEVSAFAKCLITHGAVLVGDAAEPFHEWITVNSIMFAIDEQRIFMIDILGSDVIISGKRHVLDGLSENIEEFARTSPIHRGYHYENTPGFPGFDEGSFSLTVDILTES